LVDGFGRPFAPAFAAGFLAFSFTTFFDAAFDFGLTLLLFDTFLLAIAVPLAGCHARESGHPVITVDSKFCVIATFVVTGSPLPRGRR
jgi:hypothetical protein